ncbi:glutamine amidotransferase [Acetitomaculum ruminis DSM 5522]|uniref:Imidazole glycerol phosphate synthase subunit HisH n=1 Tax=Acetitomaculum ruminis DSM 5522 TaxID=1120918 RepID=A0A1I0V2H9_9FIRM|nr:imidazole glycerol phosphate synthase subunit HisH [Acetitomaculum ruminis]SFA70237.1 glutamine amidotransferase [Acetitomaculum ruminis DSM 5522]
MIAIIDYDAGNIKSVEKAIEFLGKEAIVTKDEKEILKADKIILPGVGSFGDAMGKLKEYELDSIIKEAVNQDIPFLGICLGLQLLFASSDESKGIEGLGLLKGRIKAIPARDDLKIPHIGWNSLELSNDGKLFKGIDNESYVYFVHSFYLKAEDEAIVKASTEYGVKIHASVEKDNIFACQFHPEKSGQVGLNILKNFIELK